MPMTNFRPTFHTAQLTLQPADSSNFWELWDIWSEPDICRWMFGEVAVTLELANEAFDQLQAGAFEGLGVWMLKPSRGTRSIGFASLTRGTLPETGRILPRGPVEMKLAVRPLARRLSCGHEAARALIRHVFDDLGQPFLVAQCETEALAANCLASRLGFKSADTRSESSGSLRSLKLSREQFSSALLADAASAWLHRA